MSRMDEDLRRSESPVADPGTDETTTGQAPPPRVDRATPGLGSPVWSGGPETRRSYGVVTLFGVVLPLVAVAVETTTGWCAGSFFDPLPTVWHALLYASIAGASLAVMWAHSRGQGRRLALLCFLNGTAVGTSSLFAVQFLPLLPAGAIAIMFLGLGFCAWSPVLALWASLICRGHTLELAAAGRAPRPRVFWAGVALPLLLLGLIGLPDLLTEIGFRAAASPDAVRSARAVSLLRAWGNRDAMLRLCYERPQGIRDFGRSLLAAGDPITVDDARKVFYRVTGLPFNSVAPPRPRGLQRWSQRGAAWRIADSWEFDADQGGTVVAGQLKGLSLDTSQMDASVDPEAALAYLEWTLVFRNVAHVQREARAQVALLPGAVVSRLTLWVDGQEREAAFALREKARGAYQQVAIQQRRDPVLLTTCGPDRVLVQCFPVQPNGGTMKVRLGMTAPLALEDRTRGRLLLPYLLERNFGARDTAPHSVWVESKGALRAVGTGLRREQAPGGVQALRGDVSDADLASGTCAIECSRPDVATAWTPDPGQHGALVRQRLVAAASAAPKRVVFVIDASGPVRSALPDVLHAIGQLPAGTEAAVIAASDRVDEIARAGSAEADRVAAGLKGLPWKGGCDNVPALIGAWDVASAAPSGAIVWIHGPQPVLLEAAEPLEQRWQRRQEGPRLYSLQVAPGPNRILERLDGLGVSRSGREAGASAHATVAAVVPLPRLGTPQQDLDRLIAGWRGTPAFVAARERVTRGTWRPGADAKATSPHLARLWAHDQVMQGVYSGVPAREKEAMGLAVRYHLVTPVTGAVVLENDQQYRDNGLTPVNPGSVPTIPEPETWALIAVAVAALLAALRRRQRCAAC